MIKKNGKLDKAMLIASEQELIKAAKDGNVTKMKLLVESGIDITKLDKHGYSPLKHLLEKDLSKGCKFIRWLNKRSYSRVLQLINDYRRTRDIRKIEI